jgi:hypothetical protein
LDISIETVKEPHIERALYRLLDNPLTRVPSLLLLLLAAPVREAIRVSAFSNSDIWWHLRTGVWILQNHAAPHFGLFSQHIDRPWIALSWLYDVLLAVLYKGMGLRAIPIMLMALMLSLAVLTFLLARGRRDMFWGPVVLSAMAQYVIVDLQPIPNVISALFFAVELTLLLQCRRTGDVRQLYVLPPLFLLWANLDGQFLLGLFLLCLFLASVGTESLLHCFTQRRFPDSARLLPLASAVALGVVIATLMTPYSFHLYPSAFRTAYSKELFRDFMQMHALSFRRPEHFIFLLLVMAAFFVLGRQRSRDIFKLGVMLLFCVLAFRIQRDAWCIVFPSIAIIADALPNGIFSQVPLKEQGWRRKRLAVGLLVAGVFAAASMRIPSNRTLQDRASRVFPIKACDYIRDNHLSMPIFNAYIWGGFLTWYLPEYPVAIDSRSDLYGEEANSMYFRVVEGKRRLETDPEFMRAQTILLERNSGMAEALTTLPVLQSQFQMVYRDNLAMVLVRKVSVR